MASPQWIGGTSTAWGTNANWSPATAPANTDSVYFNQSAANSVAGGDFTASNTLALLSINSLFASYSFGDDGTPVKVGATLVKIGEASGSSTAGSHSGRINWDGSTIASTIYVYATKGSSTDTGKEPVRLKNVNASSKLFVYGGRVGVATDSIGDVATFNTIAALGTTAYVNVSSGVTLTNATVEGGTLNLYCAATTVKVQGGTLNTFGTGAITTLSVAGTADLRSTGTITTLNVQAGGNVTLRNDGTAKTITTVKLYKGATLNYDPAVVTITNPIQVIGASIEDVTVTTPEDITLAVVKT